MKKIASVKTQILLIIIFYLSNSIAYSIEKDAVQKKEFPEEKMAAIVQYLSGYSKKQVESINSEASSIRNEQLEFKDIIGFGNSIIVSQNSILKIITHNRCVAVLYSNTSVTAPKNKNSPWIIETGSVRWVCPEEKVETIDYKGANLSIQNGEVLITNNSLIPLRENIIIGEHELSENTIYSLRNKKWIKAKKQKDLYAIYEFDRKFPSPLESSRLQVSAPTNPQSDRLFLAVIPIGWGAFHHYEEDGLTSDYNMRSYGFKLGYNFKYKEKSILTFLEYGDMENSDSKNSSPNGPSPIGYSSIKNEYAFLGIGFRHSHKNSSSFYYFGGLGYQKYDFNFRENQNTFLSGQVIYNLNAGIGGGYQKIFWHHKKISLLIGTEFKVMQSLTQGDSRRVSSSGNRTNYDPESFSTSATASVYLGPLFNF